MCPNSIRRGICRTLLHKPTTSYCGLQTSPQVRVMEKRKPPIFTLFVKSTGVMPMLPIPPVPSGGGPRGGSSSPSAI